MDTDPNIPTEIIDSIAEYRGVDDAHLGAYLALLKDEGWPRDTLAHATGLDPTSVSSLLKPRKELREAKKQLRTLEVPEYVPPTPKPVRRKIDPSPELIARARELYPLAKKSNAARPIDDPFRKASDELTELFAKAHKDGVSPSKLAKAVGMQTQTIRARLARRGKITAPPSQTVFIGAESRQQDECTKGHPLSGENLSIVQSAGGKTRRVCKQCRRDNTAKYRERLAAEEARAT